MTRHVVTNQPTSEFSTWMRNNRNLDSVEQGLAVTDADWCIHRFRTPVHGRKKQYHLWLEEKTTALPPQAQLDTLWQLHQIVTHGGGSRRIYNLRGMAIEALHLGVFVMVWHSNLRIDWYNFHPTGSLQLVGTLRSGELEEILLFQKCPNTFQLTSLHPRCNMQADVGEKS